MLENHPGLVDNNFIYYRGQDGFISGVKPTLKTWYHIALTIENNSYKFFINGQLFIFMVYI